MKNYTFLFILLFAASSAKADCTDAYASASYALSHAKQGLSANNFDHQRYYAERSLEAFEKTQGLTENCGCNASREPIWNGMVNLRKAIDPKDWEMGRFYTKKALANAQELLTALDLCTSGQDTVGDVLAYTEPEGAGEDYKDPTELEAQLNLKRMAELTIFEFEKSVKELAGLLGCEEALRLNQSLAEKTEASLQEESLEQTREFYRKQALGIQKRTLSALQQCAGVAGVEQASASGKE